MDEKRRQEVREVILEDMRWPLRWWWLSFADERGFLGVAIVQAGGLVEAAAVAHRLGINPGGEVLGVAIPEEELPEARLREKLLSADDIEREELGGGVFL